jgi:hypothetical protein
MSDAPPDTGTPDAPEAPPEAPPTDPAALAAELDKWKAQARKHEERAKANASAAKELDKVRQDAMSDQEKAVEIARQQARAEALQEVGGKLVQHAIRAAVAGRGVDADALLEGLDPTRFVNEDGDPDLDAITAWVERIAPKPETNGFTAVDLGQGARRGAIPLGSDPLTADLERVLGIR